MPSSSCSHTATHSAWPSSEHLGGVPARSVEAHLLEDRPALRVRLTNDTAPLDAQHVEHDEHQWDRAALVQDRFADEGEVGPSCVVERDEFTVEHRPHRQVNEELDVLGHVPAPTASD